MTVHLETTVTEIGPEVADLAEGGVVILFAAGAPPELAEVSVLHRAVIPPSDDAPPVGADVALGPLRAQITALGPAAWAKMREMGHIVLSFNGAAEADRPGEMCLSSVDTGALVAALQAGAAITIRS
ncbi:MAG: PTS glucitol/sorbitol transporter subunit IIA [Roseinatronobacter sp.]